MHQLLTQILIVHHYHKALLATSHTGAPHQDRRRASVHAPLLKRQREPSVAERMEKRIPQQQNGL